MKTILRWKMESKTRNRIHVRCAKTNQTIIDWGLFGRLEIQVNWKPMVSLGGGVVNRTNRKYGWALWAKPEILFGIVFRTRSFVGLRKTVGSHTNNTLSCQSNRTMRHQRCNSSKARCFARISDPNFRCDFDTESHRLFIQNQPHFEWMLVNVTSLGTISLIVSVDISPININYRFTKPEICLTATPVVKSIM